MLARVRQLTPYLIHLRGNYIKLALPCYVVFLLLNFFLAECYQNGKIGINSSYGRARYLLTLPTLPTCTLPYLAFLIKQFIFQLWLLLSLRLRLQKSLQQESGPPP